MAENKIKGNTQLALISLKWYVKTRNCSYNDNKQILYKYLIKLCFQLYIYI